MAATRTVAWSALVVVACALAYRVSWRSGATDSEASGSLPGDTVIPHPMVEWTRATTIHAPPTRVWPWLVQMGYGRGGWYTDERVDRLLWGVSAHNADAIRDDLQHLEVGDVVADGPDHAAYFHVRAVEPERALVYHSVRHPLKGHPVDALDPAALRRLERDLVAGGTYLDFSWAFVLIPEGRSTRLVIRTRAVYAPARLGLLRVPLGFVDLYHAHTMLRAIRRRVERDMTGVPEPGRTAAEGRRGAGRPPRR